MYRRNLRLAVPNEPNRNSEILEDALEELVEVFSTACRNTLESAHPDGRLSSPT